MDRDAVKDFLAQKRIAVAGVSRNRSQPGRIVYGKLKSAGYRVFALNPATDEIEGERCYADLASLPEKPDGLFVATPPEAAPDLINQCAEVGISRVWLHCSIGNGSYSEEAVRAGREKGLTVIPRGCPMMFCEPVDWAHRALRWFLSLVGRL